MEFVTVAFTFPDVYDFRGERSTLKLCDESLEALVSLVYSYIRHMQQ